MDFVVGVIDFNKWNIKSAEKFITASGGHSQFFRNEIYNLVMDMIENLAMDKMSFKKFYVSAMQVQKVPCCGDEAGPSPKGREEGRPQAFPSSSKMLHSQARRA